jgi:uncharacterized protein YndB with AHSA1/START domain
VPTVRRSRTVEAEPEAVWRLVADPHHMPRWWPRVQRVEDASPEAFTVVFGSSRGKPVRADFTRVRAERPRCLVWRQEVDETPFERFLAAAETELRLSPAGQRGTRVELEARERLRGLSTLGAFMVRRATRRRLDEALESLADIARNTA